MEQREKVNYSLILTILITLTGWGVTFGICQNKIENNTKNIERIEQRTASDYSQLLQKQNNSDVYIQSINNQLVELNTKVTLLLNGQIKAEGK